MDTVIPARILPLGDSLTLGVQGQGGGYRSFLGPAVKQNHVAGFVGALYLAGDHSGYSGHTISGIEAALRSARTMELYSPTHILLLGGTNDFYFYPPLGANASVALDRLDSLLTFLTNRSSAPLIFVATVPPVLIERCAVYVEGPCAPSMVTNIAEYNAALPGYLSQWRHRGVSLVNMAEEAGFVEADYWTAGIHFNDNGWCKMARVWYRALAPHLPRHELPLQRYAAFGAPSRVSDSSVADDNTCTIPEIHEIHERAAASTGRSATSDTAPPASKELAGIAVHEKRRATLMSAHSSALSLSTAPTCTRTVTVHLNGSAPPFASFYGEAAAALGLPFGGRGGLCAWSSIAPRENAFGAADATWTEHGASDTYHRDPSPTGPLFALLQTLGSVLVPTTVDGLSLWSEKSRLGIPLAIATVRQWATQSTIAVVVNATFAGSVCVQLEGLRRHAQPGKGGCGADGQLAATVIDLPAASHGGSRGGERTLSELRTRLIPCASGSTSSTVSPLFELEAGGTVSALTFAIEHL